MEPEEPNPQHGCRTERTEGGICVRSHGGPQEQGGGRAAVPAALGHSWLREQAAALDDCVRQRQPGIRVKTLGGVWSFSSASRYVSPELTVWGAEQPPERGRSIRRPLLSTYSLPPTYDYLIVRSHSGHAVQSRISYRRTPRLLFISSRPDQAARARSKTRRPQDSRSTTFASEAHLHHEDPTQPPLARCVSPLLLLMTLFGDRLGLTRDRLTFLH